MTYDKNTPKITKEIYQKQNKIEMNKITTMDTIVESID